MARMRKPRLISREHAKVVADAGGVVDRYTDWMANSLKSYAPTWKGNLLLACRKCQKKLKNEPGLRALAKLKKTIKRQNRQHPDNPLHLISVPCLDLCPKRAVTICLPAAQTAKLAVLRKEEEIAALYQSK